MAKFIDINDILGHIQKEKFRNWIDRLKFVHILFLWLIVIISFGIIYFYFQNTQSYLLYNLKQAPVDKLADTIYFSFVAATTTGFGDILPVGGFKIVAIFEVIFGMLLLALVTSKLVSIKQDVIIGELYDLSLNEKLNRIRSALLLFRQNLERIMAKIEDESLHKREVKSIHVVISSFEDSLSEILHLVEKSKVSEFLKKLDPTNTQLIFNSILNSYEKFNEFMALAKAKEIQWKDELNQSLLEHCINLTDKLFSELSDSKTLSKEIISDLNSRKITILTNTHIFSHR
jgi:hypothetical protein